jgi:peptide/nickel transport system substrate-binding protein
VTYWDRVLQSRLTRRRAIAATGASAAGAAFLAACGGGDGDSSSGSKDASSLLTPVRDDSKSVQRGGTFKFFLNSDQQNYDPTFTSLPNQSFTNMVYGQFWNYPGGLLKPSDGTIEGDIADSFEYSPDKLQMTIKLTDKARFGTVPAVPGANGRVPDAQDILYSWERFASQGTRRSDLANSVSPEAPILSMTAPDKQTVVIKMAQPVGIFQHLMSNTQAGNMFILPKEAADPNLLDLRRTQLGTGPWQLDKYEPSIGYTYKRNPGFGQDRRGLGQLPYIDQMDSAIVTEYAAQLAQFKTGNIHYMGRTGMRGEDILPSKKDIPQLEIVDEGVLPANTRYFFGMLPESPFKDERVRQAW